MALDPYFEKLIDGIETHGFYTVGVGAGEGTPAFRYSIGFWETLSAPEMLICGLGFDLMHDMLWRVFKRLKDGERVGDGAHWSGLIDGYDCIFRRVHPTQAKRFVLSALWYRKYRTGDEDIEVFQMFWPGVQQRLFPWEESCDPSVRSAQPALYLPYGAH